ncbi:MAG: hypothetical protein ACI31M_03470 [Bacilli bacterium]
MKKNNLFIKSIKEIANHYGKNHQEIKTIEEINELRQELFANIYEGVTDNTPSEIADVLIMVSQLIYIYDIEEKVKDEIVFKINRQLKRIIYENDNKM